MSYFLIVICLAFFTPITAQARAVDEVKIKPLPDGYEIRVNFLFAIQYQSSAPNKPAKELYVQLKAIDFKVLNDQEISSLRERLNLGPGPSTNISLQEIIFEGGDPERPQMTFLFSEEVECDVHSSGDLRSLILTVKTPGKILARDTKEALQTVKPPAKKEKSKWLSKNYGSFSQFYYRDQTTPEGQEAQINRSDLSSDWDWRSKLKNGDIEVNARFTGGYQQNFLKDKKNQDSLSALSVDMNSKKKGIYGRLGRQSLNTGGVLGRFDGSHLAIKLNPAVKLNAVFGYPVESVRQTNIDTDKKFYGANLDFINLLEKWDFNTFFINQENCGLTDRRAIGAEARYFDLKKALFTLVDYDIFFNELDIFLLNGHWSFPSKTTANLVFDYRKSPLLTLNNAIQGQGVDKVSDLLSSFTERELKQLAKDRTANSTTATFGVTQDLKKDLQATAEVSVSELDGTITSGGVEGQKSTGFDYTYSAQFIASNVLKENDVVISRVSYLDGARHNTYSLNLNGHFPLRQKLRFIPKFRFDYRDAKSGEDNRVSVRPSMRFDYNFTRWAHFEIEGGFEWLDERSFGISHQSTETFVSAGYRIIF